MSETDDIPSSRVQVNFHSSSTKDGREAFAVTVLEGVTPEEAQRVYDLAVALRRQAVAELAPKSLEEQLEASVAKVRIDRANRAISSVADRWADRNALVDAAEANLPRAE